MLANPLILKTDGEDIVEKEQKILLMLIDQQKNMKKTISELMLLQSYLPDKKLLSIHEKYWIKFYNTFEDDFHYNLTPGGETVMLDRHHTEESKKRMSEVKLGEQNPFYGKKHTEETKKLMSENHADVSGKNHPNYGKPREMKTKLKVSEKQNTTGYFRVIKAPCKQCKQGFRWRYSWREMGKRKELSSVDIKELEKKLRKTD